MSQEEIVAQVRKLAAANGGRLGMRTFFEETGVSEHWLRKQIWYTGWNSLIDSLGFETQSFAQVKYSRDDVAHSFASLALRLRKWPTDDDVNRERARDPSFPGLKTIRPLKRSGLMAKLVVELSSSDPGLSEARQYAEPHVKDVVTETHENKAERIRGYVYMMRSGRRYKIGKSLDPSRRFREVKLQLPEETSLMHAIATDDPAGIEGYWHRRFESKRVRNTEFFELTAEDVTAFRRREYQ